LIDVRLRAATAEARASEIDKRANDTTLAREIDA
jgi:hypothetical protein